MNRFKLLLLVLILAVLSVLFVQNQELLSLKFFCADVSQYCVYQTPQLPLAAWIGLFILAGLFTSLVGQFFSSLGRNALQNRDYNEPTSFNYHQETNSSPSPQPRTNSDYSPLRNDSASFQATSGSRFAGAAEAGSTSAAPRSSSESNKKVFNSVSNQNTTIQSDWETSQDDDWNLDQPSPKTIPDNPNNYASTQDKSYEVRREPTNVQRSGSTYSYTYREATENRKDEDSQVYDAKYRTINPPYKPLEEEHSKTDENDEDWI
jgi:hypothetical protein